MPFAEVYLVRHGKDNYETGSLTAEGKAQSERAAQELLGHGLSQSALVLSSDLPRALETASIISEALGSRLLSSRRINHGGNNPEAVENLSDWIDKAISEAGESTGAFTDCVVVTHQPLIHTALHGSRSKPDSGSVDNGEVVKFELSTFDNDKFRPGVAQSYEELLRRKDS